jgi:hypothetical protein
MVSHVCQNELVSVPEKMKNSGAKKIEKNQKPVALKAGILSALNALFQ